MMTLPSPVQMPRRLRPPGGTPSRRYTARPATVAQREIFLHGQPVTYLEAGAETGGPVVVLLHGLASSSQTWATVMPLLGVRMSRVSWNFGGGPVVIRRL
jgi:pimeloyl-ACP methyl ester carboxylesterase